MKGTIALLATLDTKAAEAAYMRGLFEALGFEALVIDVGTGGPEAHPAAVTHREVARAAGRDLDELVRTETRDSIMEAMGKGAGEVLLRLYRERRISGVIGFGGNQGTAIASMAMKRLPFGFPKYLVSTIASGNMRPYVGCKDIGAVFAVGDFLGGPSPVTRSILANAAAAMAGMAEHGARIAKEEAGRTVAITALGNTEAAAGLAVRLLEDRGFVPIPFHASGAGGSAMEELIEEGFIEGVLDLTPHELTEEVVGEGVYMPVRPGRLTAAGQKGIPQVVSTGAMEYLCFGPASSIPPGMSRRPRYMHNPMNANVRASTGEMIRVAETMAERLNSAKGPTAMLVPRRGWSVYGAKGGPLHSDAAYRAFQKTLRASLEARILFEDVDAHINDALFVGKCVEVLAHFMDRSSEGGDHGQGK